MSSRRLPRHLLIWIGGGGGGGNSYANFRTYLRVFGLTPSVFVVIFSYENFRYRRTHVSRKNDGFIYIYVSTCLPRGFCARARYNIEIVVYGGKRGGFEYVHSDEHG